MEAKCADPDEYGETLVMKVQVWEPLGNWRWEMHWLSFEDILMGQQMIGAQKQKEGLNVRESSNIWHVKILSK